MGLLRKAAGAVARGDGRSSESAVPVFPLERAAPSALSQGLLRRSIKALVAEKAVPASPPPSAVRATRPLEELTGEILSSISSLADGVELPSQLFTTLVSGLSIKKGALLLYDPLRLVYAPWASQGYDQTTLHRMRISLGANTSFNALANGEPIVISGTSALSTYRQFFSAREFSVLSRIILAPFIAEQKLIGVLLLTEAKPALDGDQELLSCLAGILEAGSRQVQKAREERLRRAGARGLRPIASPEEETERYVASSCATGAKCLFLSLSLEEYSRRIIAAQKHLDPFRLHEDLHYFLGAFVADLGTVIPIRQGLFIVALQGLDIGDFDLFLHQLSSFLRGLFGGNGQSGAEAGPRILKTRSWPEDGTDARELVAFFSS
jgi:hypothetical protein